MAATDETYFIPQGYVSIAPRVSFGAINGGFKRVGETEAATINVKQTFEDAYDNTTGHGFKVLHSPVQTEASIKLNLTQWTVKNLQTALYGVPASQAAGGTVTGETITAYNGTDFYLGGSLSGGMALGVTALTLTAGATPLVLNTDYTLDGSYGRVTILPGSTVVPAGAGVVLTAGYTYAATNGNVGAFTQGPTEYAIRFDVKNVAVPYTDADGSAYQAVGAIAYRVVLDATKVMELVSKKHGILELDGDVLIDPTVTPTAGSPRSQLFNIMKA